MKLKERSRCSQRNVFIRFVFPLQRIFKSYKVGVGVTKLQVLRDLLAEQKERYSVIQQLQVVIAAMCKKMLRLRCSTEQMSVNSGSSILYEHFSELLE